jgi:hypothetical protein
VVSRFNCSISFRKKLTFGLCSIVAMGRFDDDAWLNVPESATSAIKRLA